MRKHRFTDADNSRADSGHTGTGHTVARTELPVQAAAMQQNVLRLQQSSGNIATHRALSAIPQFPLLQVQPTLQRQPRLSGQSSPVATTEQTPLSQSETVAPEQMPFSAVETDTATDTEPQNVAVQRLIVENSEQSTESGKMRKDDFLAELRRQICGAADDEMVQSEFSAQGCPWIDMYMRFYEGRSAARIERDLLRYAPEAAGVPSARDYIPFIAARVRRSVAVWLETGEITGVPEGVPSALPGFGLLGRLLFKARPGASSKAGFDPLALRSQLGRGQALASSVQSRMAPVFGRSFAQVRIHDDANAARLSDQHNARAFTLGRHVAFGAGEYRPGTIAGDALIAHELAHVVQQRGATNNAAPLQKGAANINALEADADSAAAGAIAALWGKGALATSAGGIMPQLRSGLKLQRCTRQPQYVTNLGRSVTALRSGAPPTAPDLTDTQADAILTHFGLLGSVTKIRSPSNRYDCHGYTFAGGNSWINDDQVDRILTDNGYSVTATPVVGDIVIYRLGGSITHSGVITHVTGGTVTEIRSKWGRSGLYEHAPDDVPPAYGSWEPYHTTRSGGHRLRRR